MVRPCQNVSKCYAINSKKNIRKNFAQRQNWKLHSINYLKLQLVMIFKIVKFVQELLVAMNIVEVCQKHVEQNARKKLVASYFVALISKNVYEVVEMTYCCVKRTVLPVTNVACPVANTVVLLSVMTLVAMNVNNLVAMNAVFQNFVKKHATRVKALNVEVRNHL